MRLAERPSTGTCDRSAALERQVKSLSEQNCVLIAKLQRAVDNETRERQLKEQGLAREAELRAALDDLRDVKLIR
jgi:hypothetical protein